MVQEVGQGAGLRFPQALHQVVPGRQAERVGAVPRPAHQFGHAEQGGAHLGVRRRRVQDLYVPAAVHGSEPLRQRAEEERRQEGRPGDDLSSHDPRARDLHAGLRPHRRHPFHHFRRVLRQVHDRPHPGLPVDAAHHRRRRHAGRQVRGAQGQRRRGAERVPEGQDRHRRQACDGQDAHGTGPRHLVARRSERRRHRAVLRAREDGRRGPALHPVYLRLHGQAQRRAAHHGGIHALYQPVLQVHLRLSRRGHPLLHRRHRVGHGPQLHRLRPALDRRDQPHVRRHPELPESRQVLGHRGQAPDQHLLHGAHGHPGAR